MAKKAAAQGGKSLVIVESPAKARTIGKFLGNEFTVEASIGHIRDLPQGAKEVPEEFKNEEWAYLGVNVDQDFTPIYVDSVGQEETGHQAPSGSERRQGPVSGDGRRPRGRGDQLASVRSSQAQGSGPSPGVSRNHRGGDSRGAADTRGKSTRDWSRPRKRAAFWIGCTATKCRPCCGERSARGCRRDASRAWRCG